MFKSKTIIAILCSITLGFISCSSDGNKQDNNAAANTSLDSAATSSDAVDKDFVLEPGDAAGKIKINEDSEEVLKVLGRPDSSDAAMQKMVAFWYDDSEGIKHSTSIYAVRDTGDMPKARVKQIRITSPKFKASNGIGVASTLDEIKKVYNVHKIQSFKTENNELDVWDSHEGIAFEIDNGKACTAIIIHQKGEELSGTYLPLR
ncbi:hypothetical protein [Pedobacter metabolipauper]|uniref:Lipoprotein n=1 Tax=Pedobacter metabolipauper TaxID=425513 RepID=A0A4R6SVS0_9SPHI|nr:hypothetical protein [Pedobacter metabolipauper]TDQ09456.1 hypothetical protein ATK78_1610 [Pedobacter metabolipauper]